MIEFIIYAAIVLGALSIAIRILDKVLSVLGKIFEPVFSFFRPAVEFIFGAICVVAVICFIISLIIPDPVPLVDEIFFGGSAVGSYTLIKVYD